MQPLPPASPRGARRARALSLACSAATAFAVLLPGGAFMPPAMSAILRQQGASMESIWKITAAQPRS